MAGALSLLWHVVAWFIVLAVPIAIGYSVGVDHERKGIAARAPRRRRGIPGWARESIDHDRLAARHARQDWMLDHISLPNLEVRVYEALGGRLTRHARALLQDQVLACWWPRGGLMMDGERQQATVEVLACCPACRNGERPVWIGELGKCCCFHTPPRPFTEKAARRVGT